MSRMLLLGVSGTRAASAALTFQGRMMVAPPSIATTDFSLASISPAVNDLCIVAYADTTSAATVTAKGSSTAFSTALLGAQSNHRWDEGSSNASARTIKCYRRVLNSADVSNGNITIAGHASSSGGMVILIRGGATTAIGNALPNYQANGSATALPGVTGFTPGGSTKGGLILAAVGGATLDVTGATGWTIEGDGLTAGSGTTFSVLRNFAYAGGTVTANQTALGSNFAEVAFMLELQ